MADGEKVEEEVVPSLRRRLLDLTLANENNATIWLGVDRPPTDNDYKEDALPNKGKPYSGTIDLTTGRNSRNPNYDTDKSRIYVSSKTKGDTNFGLTEKGFLVKGDTILEENEEGQAYIVAKSDSVRIIAREDVRIQNQNNGSSITMKANGDVVIYTENNIKFGNEFANQPVVMSRELTEALRAISNALLEHKHTDAMGRPTSSPTIAAPPPAKAAIDKINSVLGNLKQDKLGRNTITSNTIWAYKGKKNND